MSQTVEKQEKQPFIAAEHMRNFHKFTAKKQTNAGTHQGKWCVYRPDGLRLVVCEEGQKQARALAYVLNYATAAFATEGRGDWASLLNYGAK